MWSTSTWVSIRTSAIPTLTEDGSADLHVLGHRLRRIFRNILQPALPVIKSTSAAPNCSSGRSNRTAHAPGQLGHGLTLAEDQRVGASGFGAHAQAHIHSRVHRGREERRPVLPGHSSPPNLLNSSPFRVASHVSIPSPYSRSLGERREPGPRSFMALPDSSSRRGNQTGMAHMRTSLLNFCHPLVSSNKEAHSSLSPSASSADSSSPMPENNLVASSKETKAI